MYIRDRAFLVPFSFPGYVILKAYGSKSSEWNGFWRQYYSKIVFVDKRLNVHATHFRERLSYFHGIRVSETKFPSNEIFSKLDWYFSPFSCLLLFIHYHANQKIISQWHLLYIPERICRLPGIQVSSRTHHPQVLIKWSIWHFLKDITADFTSFCCHVNVQSPQTIVLFQLFSWNGLSLVQCVKNLENLKFMNAVIFIDVDLFLPPFYFRLFKISELKLNK